MFTNNAKPVLGFNININVILFINLLLFSSFVSYLNCDRIKDKIYKHIESKYFCFRLLDEKHQIGCNTKEGGNSGTVYMISSTEDVNHVIKSGSDYPYIPVITPKHFNLQTLNRFKDSSDRISGVLVVDTNEQNRNSLSADKSCPNEMHSLYVNDSTYGFCRQQEWNLAEGPRNKGLLFNDWPFPIFYIKNETNIQDIKDCFDRFGGPDYPLCAIHLKSPMNAAKDSITCIRRTYLQMNSYSMSQTLFCDPLSGSNIFSTLLSTSKNYSIANNSLIVLAARLDSFSMFDAISPGADSAITSLVTLLTIGQTLNKVKKEIIEAKNGRNVLFALFDGEAFDYIGSSRTLYNMNAGVFPFDPKTGFDFAQIQAQHISHFIELNQLAPHGTDGANKHNLWIHKNLKSNKEIDKMSELLTKNAQTFATTLALTRIGDGKALPPSSLQTFLKSRPSMAGVVIANHDKEFTNKYYNSIFDDVLNVNKSDSKLSQRLANIATVVSRTVYELLTDRPPKDLSADETTVSGLLECYLTNSNCELFKYMAKPGAKFPDGPNEPYPTYVGVYRPSSPADSYKLYSHRLLSYLTGDELNLTQEDCSRLNKESQQFYYYWMSGHTMNGTCIKSQAIKIDKITSPAFDKYMEGQVLSPELYSTWTESQWSHVEARLFLKPSLLQQWLTLITGLIFLFLSFVVIYFINKKSSILFNISDDIVTERTLTAGC